MDEQDDVFDDDLSSEGGEDYRLVPEDFRDTFIIPSDWTVSTLRAELVDIVDLSPQFQRRSVWSKKAKSKFIESLILGIPIPQILLAEDRDRRNTFLVLDGKQRLSTIKEFFSEQFDDGSAFKLQGLDDMSEINGFSWSELRMVFPDYARAVEAAAIRTAIIRGWKKDDVLYEIFYRLNSGSVKLSPMELRMSLIRGPYVREVISRTAELKALQELLGLRSADKRMKDVEVAIRFLAFDRRLVPYRGNLKQFLDDFCRVMNQNFNERQLILDLEELESVVSLGLSIVPEGNFARKFLPREGRYERSFNRAIFDVLAASLSNPVLASKAAEHPTRFEDAFKQVCENTEFLRFVESTTKSVEATRGRFVIWQKVMQDSFGASFKMPLFGAHD